MDTEPQTEPDEQPNEMNESEPSSAPVPAHQLTRRERRHRQKMVLLIVGGVVAALLLAAAAYWFFLRGDDNKRSAQTNTGQQTGQEETPAPVAADPTPVAYKSTKLNIELTHRKDWTLKEADDGELTITSPQISYTRSDGQATTGVFTVKIRKGVPEPMQATIEKAVAPRKSEVIAYTSPTKEQRQYTNLSFAGQKDIFNFFIVTGNTEFKAGGAFNFALSLNSQFYLIVGGYGEDKAGSLGFDAVPAAAMDSDALTQGVDIVESLKIF